MFILEESQLLEDTIKDPSVLRLYKELRKNESLNDRSLLVPLFNDDRFVTTAKLILQYYKLNNGTSKLSPEQRDDVLKVLNLQKEDIASLVLIFAATMTQLFSIDNFTGPIDNEDSYHMVPEVFQQAQLEFDFKSLTVDGSEVYHRLINPWLLKLTQLSWNFLDGFGCSRRLLELEFLVWKHRYLTIYLTLLHEPSESIVNELRKLQEFIFDHHIINDIRENKTQLVRFNIVEICCELIQSSLLRDGITSCRKILDYACEASGVSIEHTGVLGKRTKFQQKNIPQLLIRVKKLNNELEMQSDMTKHTDLPKDAELQDDTLLPDVSFVSESSDGSSNLSEENLSVEAQLLMLAKLDYILKTEVMEESLKDEWTLAYVRSIIKSASIWIVKFKALCIRSVVEKKHMRRIDRALLQLEELIKTVDKPDKNHSFNRMKSFYSTLPLCKWQVQRSLGDISFDLGLFKSALESYLNLEHWEGIIRCHSALGETVKAEEVIRQQLAVRETPYLYCLLGDATDKIQYYEKSWSLSNGRFARAKKSIGTYYYVRKQYSEAIENYELALAQNPSNISILSLLGYCCLTLERYERAAECYRNITYNDDTNFLAWNNLSKAYIKLNQKERAWRTLREAIKCNYEEWKIWENFMLVSVEIGALDDVIMAWHRLLDIKSSHNDDQILSALTYSLIKRSYTDVNPEFVKLYNDALKLVARLNTTSACSSRAWMCYFRLLLREFEMLKSRSGIEKLSKLDIDSRVSKITNALQRSVPSTIASDPTWFQSKEKIANTLDSYDEVIECYMLALDLLGPRREIWSQWKNSKLTMNNTLKTLRQKGYDKSD